MVEPNSKVDRIQSHLDSGNCLLRCFSKKHLPRTCNRQCLKSASRVHCQEHRCLLRTVIEFVRQVLYRKIQQVLEVHHVKVFCEIQRQLIDTLIVGPNHSRMKTRLENYMCQNNSSRWYRWVRLCFNKNVVSLKNITDTF